MIDGRSETRLYPILNFDLRVLEYQGSNAQEQYSGQDTLPLYSGIRAGEPEYHSQSHLSHA